MSTPDTLVVDYAFWRTLCDVAEADGPSPYVVVQTHTLRALLDAHEREAAREQSADTLRAHQEAGIDRAAREIAALCADHAGLVFVPGTDDLAAIMRREMEIS